MAYFVARVCVTVIGLGQIFCSFLCPGISGLLLQFMLVPLHVVTVLLCVVLLLLLLLL